MRFVVDRHLGRLAKWLRTLGYDAFFQVDCDDSALREELEKPDTHFVTSTVRITSRLKPKHFLIVDQADIGKQLSAVVSATGISPKATLFTRCVICNIHVTKIAKEDCREKVPERVYELFDDFTQCSSCGRIYWMGTHTSRLINRLQELLEIK